MQYVKQVYTSTDDFLLKKQFSYIIARHVSPPLLPFSSPYVRYHVSAYIQSWQLASTWHWYVPHYNLVFPLFSTIISPFLKGLAMEIDDEIAADDNDKEILQEIVNNTKLSEGYLTLARDIEVMEPKSPEDIYKVMNILLLTIFVVALVIHNNCGSAICRSIWLMAVAPAPVLILQDRIWLQHLSMHLWMLGLVRLAFEKKLLLVVWFVWKWSILSFLLIYIYFVRRTSWWLLHLIRPAVGLPETGYSRTRNMEKPAQPLVWYNYSILYVFLNRKYYFIWTIQ